MTAGRPRRLAALLVSAAVSALAVLGPAGPANAHATLIGTDPAEGAVLAEAPDRIRFTFDEAVVAVPDGVQVFDARGGPVASSTSVSGAELDVALQEPVGDGTLVVTWRVVSEDGHPISGSLSFSVGAPSARVAAPPREDAGPTRAPWELSLTKWVGYAGLLLSVGLVAFTLLFLPARSSTDRARHRLVTTARAAAAVTVVAWLAGLPLTAAYQLGGGATLAMSGAAWGTLSPGEYAVTVAVVGGVLLAVGLLGRGRPARLPARAALGLGVVAVSAPALTGHTRAATPEVLAVGVDALHLLAGSVWLGGLVGLALALPTLAGARAEGVAVLARFSVAAAGVLATLVATGSVLAWRISGSWSALVESGYGQLLLVKVGIAVVAVLIAGWNRYALLPRVDRAGTRLVARSTAAEAGVLVAVLLVTGFLVDQSPEIPAAAAGPAGPGRAGARIARLENVVVRATLSPGTIGTNTVTVELRDPTGGPAVGVQSLRARLSSDRADLGRIPLTFTAAGTYTADVLIPAPGTWRLQVSLRLGEFDNPVTTLDFPVAGG